MATRKPRASAAKPQAQTGSYVHTDAKAIIRPEIGVQTYAAAKDKFKRGPVKYRYDDSLAPELAWDSQNPTRERGEALIAQIEQASVALAQASDAERPGLIERINTATRELKARLMGKQSNGNGKLLYPKQAERFRWSKWRFKSGTDLRDFVRDHVFPYMASLAKDEPEVAEYFRDAVLEIVDPNVLKQVIDELDGFEFRKLGPDVKGDIFEYLLVHLGSSSLNGQFRTPRQIRAFMVEMVDPDIGDSLFDPAMGTAGFLIDAVDYLWPSIPTTSANTPSTARTG